MPALPHRPRRFAATAFVALAFVTLVFVTVASLGGLVACSSSASTPPGGAASGYPVTVTTCGDAATYAHAPNRAVSNDINTTEDMLALDVGAHMVGDFGVGGDGPEGQPVPSQFRAAFDKVPDISPGYFTLEKLVALHPDFLFAGWDYGLQAGTSLTPQNLAHYGIKTLALTESCAKVQSSKASVSIEDTYQDLSDLGRIFGVEPKAAMVVAAMKAQVAAVQQKVAGIPPVTVFDYDSGMAAPFTAPGLAMPTAEIALAGGTNIFAGLNKSWTSVSWEQVVAANPQCIIINDYGTPTAADKEQFLETSPITSGLAAVKHRCFLTLSYDQVTPSPRDADAVETIARWLHPSAFGLPADGA